MMKGSDSQRRRVLLLAIAASVLLFACKDGSKQRSGEPSKVPSPAVTSPAQLASIPASGSAAAQAESQAESPEEEVPEQASLIPDVSAKAAARDEESGTRVFSNKDLKRYSEVKEEFGFRDDTVVVDLSGKQREEPEEAIATMTAAERDQEMAATREKISSLSGEVEYLKKRIPSLHNPFLPRATLNEADQTAEAGMDNAQRLERVNSRIAEAERQLSDLQRRLAELHNLKPSGAKPAREED